MSVGLSKKIDLKEIEEDKISPQINMVQEKEDKKIELSRKK